MSEFQTALKARLEQVRVERLEQTEQSQFGAEAFPLSLLPGGSMLPSTDPVVTNAVSAMRYWTAAGLMAGGIVGFSFAKKKYTGKF